MGFCPMPAPPTRLFTLGSLSHGHPLQVDLTQWGSYQALPGWSLKVGLHPPPGLGKALGCLTALVQFWSGPLPGQGQPWVQVPTSSFVSQVYSLFPTP